MKLIGYILVIVFLFVVLSNFRTPEDYGEERQKSLKDNIAEFDIGVVWPFSTKKDFFREGIMLAAEEINSSGLLDQQINMIYRDTASKVSVAQKISDEFIKNENMLAVMGHYDSTITEQLSVGYDQANLLCLCTGARVASLTDHNFDYLMRTCINSRMIAKNMVNGLAEMGYRKLFVVTQEDDYGRDIKFHFEYFMDFKDMDLCGANSYFRWEKNFNDIVYNLRTASCDLLFLCGFEPWAGYFLRDMRNMGINIPFAATLTHIDDMRKVTGSASQDAIYFTSYNPNAGDQDNMEFVRKFVKRFGEEPDASAVRGYDTLHMLAYAIKTTGTLKPLALSYFIKYCLNYDGVNGKYRFNPGGEVIERPFYLKQVKGNESVIIWSND